MYKPSELELVKRSEAARNIANILANLEKETGCIVETIGLESIDITTIQGNKPTILQSVVIEMRRVPGNQWAI